MKPRTRLDSMRNAAEDLGVIYDAVEEMRATPEHESIDMRIINRLINAMKKSVKDATPGEVAMVLKKMCHDSIIDMFPQEAVDDWLREEGDHVVQRDE